jgi:hypothetical protein
MSASGVPEERRELRRRKVPSAATRLAKGDVSGPTDPKISFHARRKRMASEV